MPAMVKMKLAQHRFAPGLAHRAEIFLVAACVVVGVGLRLVQYFERGSLWLDEAMLALNVVTRTPRQLIFSPLDYNQVAPPLYMQITKAATLLAGPTEQALRFTAFASSLAALITFAFVARRALKGVEVPFAVLMFAISPTLVRYSAEVKQYSGDALAAVLLTLIAFQLRDSGYSKRWLIVAVVIPMGVVWFSDPSTLILGGLGLGLAILAWLEKDRRALGPAKILAPVWFMAIVAAAAGSHRRMANGTSEIMHRLWKAQFVSLPPSSLAESISWWQGLRHISRETLGIRTVGGFFLLVGLVGIWSLWKRGRRDVVILVFGPYLVAIAASMAHVYPFAARLTLFLFPVFIIAMAAGVGAISRPFGRIAPIAAVALTLILLSPPYFILHATTPAWVNEDIQSVLAKISKERRPGDRIFVFWGAVPATIFYGPRYGIAQGDWVPGGLHGDDGPAYLAEFDQFRTPGRLWVIFSHDRVPGQRAWMISYIEAFASLDSISASHAHDMSDPATFLFNVPSRAATPAQ